MTERFFTDKRSAAKQCAALRAYVLTELARARWLEGSGGRLVGMGGTVRNLAAAAATPPGGAVDSASRATCSSATRSAG